MPRPRLTPTDAAALGALGAWLGWVALSTGLSGRLDALGSTYVVAPLATLAGVIVGRLAARSDAAASDREGFTWVDVLLICLVVALLPGVRLRLAPGPVPLGYANANTAAATQVMVLCVLAVLNRGRPALTRAVLATGAVAAGYAAVHHGSTAGLTTAAPVALAALWVTWRTPRRKLWASGLGIASLGAAGAALLWLASRDSWPPALLRALDPVRQTLWEVALGLWRAHPVTGGGPGSYVLVNPYGYDPDTMAAHSSLLQVGAELGLVGVVLLAALVAAGYVLAGRGAAPYAILATAAWTALWVHSLVDHLFDYPAVPLLAGVVLGWAGATARPRPVAGVSISTSFSAGSL